MTVLMKKSGLIIIPYACGGNTGVSIQNVGRQVDIYLKNVCVAALSAKVNSGDVADVMVVTNIDLPEPYCGLLAANGVPVEKCPFDRFNFGKEVDGKPVLWQLAFYKLCALAFCVGKFDYDFYAFLDSDVFVQASFADIWREAADRILLYDLNEPVNGYMVKEMREFLNTQQSHTHYGGEFFAASRQLARVFIEKCQKVYDEMLEAGYMTKSGDEFITSIAASRLDCIKNGGAYVRRYWTGSYRLICNDYDKKIVVLHIPAEKEQGILKLYNRYVSKGTVPGRQTVWRLTHLKRRSLRVIVGVTLRRLHIVN